MYIFLQYGGPDGELAASLRYLSQRFTMPYPELKAILTDIGSEVQSVSSFWLIAVNFLLSAENFRYPFFGYQP